MSKQNLVYNALKKDEDAIIVEAGGSHYIETTANVPMERVLTVTVNDPTDETLLEDAAVAPMPDVRIHVLFTTFVAHNLATLVCLAVSLPLFFWGLERSVAIGILVVACLLQLVCYFGMILLRKKQPQVAFGFYVGWVFNCALIVGTASSLLNNISPIQLMATIWVETLVIIVYCKLSPHDLSTWRALIYMCIAAVGVWAVFIAEFVVERDWIAGTIILILGLVCATYHAFQIRASEAHSYNMSWDDTILSIVQFYADPVLLFKDKFCAN